jgi:ADP-heptose:LPS heptosyltransferase
MVTTERAGAGDARQRALVALSLLARALPRRRAAWPPRRVLLIRPDHLGDLLLTTPALRLLRAQWPEAHVTALVGPWAAEVLRRSPHVDVVHRCDFPWFNRRPRRQATEPYALLVRTAAVLRTRCFDLAINLRFDFWWGAALAALAGVPRVAGYDWPTCRPFLTDPVPWPGERHAVAQAAALVAAVSGAPEARAAAATRWPLEFRLRAAERAFAARVLPGDGRWVALHPGSGAPVKHWPLAHWCWLAQQLVAEGLRLVWTGSAIERALCVSLAAAVGGVVAAGATTLGQLAALYERCALVLGPDSGPLHLAAAVGTPTVRLFGPADAALFGPHAPDDGRHVVVSTTWPCAPCGRLDYAPDILPYHRCMAGILPARVLAAARVVLAAAQAEPVRVAR